MPLTRACAHYPFEIQVTGPMSLSTYYLISPSEASCVRQVETEVRGAGMTHARLSEGRDDLGLPPASPLALLYTRVSGPGDVLNRSPALVESIVITIITQSTQTHNHSLCLQPHREM